MYLLGGEQPIRIGVASERAPEQRACFGVERIEILVIGPDEDRAARDRRRGDDVEFGLEAPEQRAIARFERIDIGILPAEIHHAVGDRRRGVNRAACQIVPLDGAGGFIQRIAVVVEAGEIDTRRVSDRRRDVVRQAIWHSGRLLAPTLLAVARRPRGDNAARRDRVEHAVEVSRPAAKSSPDSSATLQRLEPLAVLSA